MLLLLFQEKGLLPKPIALGVIMIEPKELGLGAWDEHNELVPAGGLFPVEGGGRQGGKGNVELCL